MYIKFLGIKLWTLKRNIKIKTSITSKERSKR